MKEKPMLTDIELMRIQADVLYEAQMDGQLLRVNEPFIASSPNEAKPKLPQLFWGYTSQGSVLRHHNLSAQVMNDLCYLIDNTSSSTNARELRLEKDDLTWTELVEKVRNCLGQVARIESEWMGPAYLLPQEEKLSQISQKFNNGLELFRECQLINKQNAVILQETFPSLYGNWMDRQPCFAVVENHQAVSVCYSARQTPQAAEAGVETLPSHRGRGYAVLITSMWSEAVYQSGRLALYSTSWDNAASRKVAERLGGYQYGIDLSFYKGD